MLVQPLLSQVAGPNTAPVSLSIEYGVDLAAGESVQVEARIIRGTRTLVFAQARLMNLSGQMAADISAVFRRQTGMENAPEGSTGHLKQSPLVAAPKIACYQARGLRRGGLTLTWVVVHFQALSSL
jgi:hypothetical protein